MTDTEVRVPAAPQAEAPEAPITTAAPPTRGNPRARRRWLSILAVIVVIGVVVWGVFHFLLAPPVEETDDAYVAGDVVSITARDAGQVTAIYADNTETVKAGQPLIDLDPATADVNLASAAAELARAVRATRADFSKLGATGAAVVQARAELARATDDLRRRRGAAAEGAVSGEELAHAQDSVKVARANLDLALSQQQQSRTSVQGTSVDTNPAVLAAVAAYRRAAITRSHMHLVAPIDGVVAQRTVQLGQQVAAGTPLMAVVPLDRVWIDANMRETQLKDLRIGQSATVTADMYGGDLVYHGRRRRRRRRQRQCVRAVAAPECERELDQDRPARAGARRARSARAARQSVARRTVGRGDRQHRGSIGSAAGPARKGRLWRQQRRP